MTTFILIHGAWHAGWCWEKVTALLSQQGHDVIVPDLPGHGANQKTPSAVKFQDYIDCIKECVARCVQPPVLVGHSFAGMLLTQYAADYPGTFKKIIYVSAYIPFSGESMLSISEKFSQTLLGPELIIDKTKKSITLKSDNLAKILFNSAPVDAQTWAISKLEAEPLIPLATPVELGDFNYGDIDSHYIFCEQDRAITLPDQQWMAERTRGKQSSLLAGHAPFLSLPEKLIELMLYS